MENAHEQEATISKLVHPPPPHEACVNRRWTSMLPANTGPAKRGGVICTQSRNWSTAMFLGTKASLAPPPAGPAVPHLTPLVKAWLARLVAHYRQTLVSGG